MTGSFANRNEDSVPFDSGYMKVGDIHSIYYEQHGKKDGKPVVFLHGGPGARATLNKNLVFFDLSIFRVVLFDQRGAGKSLPFAELRENTSQLLVQDIESLRTRLSIPKWHMVFGGSWGSTLALLYAQTHPEAVSSLVLRGIFLLTEDELRWTYPPGTSTEHNLHSIFPDVVERWQKYLADMGEDLSDPISSYYRLMTQTENPDTAMKAAQEWARPECTTIGLHVDMDEVERELQDIDFLLPVSRIECSYFKHRGWMRDGQLLEKENIDRIKHIPTSIVHGRYDVICPAKYAWMLHNALGGNEGMSELFFPIAGHDKFEPETLEKTIEICKRYGEMSFD